MMTMANETETARLMDKLRKILALTNSPLEGEAQAAAAMLQKFLTLHNLDIADLEAKGAAAPGVRETTHDLGKAAFKWKLDLAESIAVHYYCYGLVDHKKKTVAFIGRPENVQSLQMLYGWLIDQIKRIANDERKVWMAANPGEHMDPLRWQVNFGEGAVIRLARRLEELKAKQSADIARDANGDIVGLALHHAREVSDFLETEYGFRTDGGRTKEELARDERFAKWNRERAQEEAEEREMLERNPAEYYAKFPWRHPDEIAKAEAQSAKDEAERAKRAARNAKRRKGGRDRAYNPERERQEDQAYEAHRAGRAAADKVNLQPFIGGEVARATKGKLAGKGK